LYHRAVLVDISLNRIPGLLSRGDSASVHFAPVAAGWEACFCFNFYFNFSQRPACDDLG
jgi:hypothetical protein